VAEAIRVAYQDRSAQTTWEDAERLTSREWARERAAEMRLAGGVGGAGAGGAEVDGGGGAGHTTHLTTADSRGNVVALTQSLGPSMGSRVAAPGLGFLYAATLGGYLGDMRPGERASSHISPLLVLSDGEPYLALGAAGGGRIPPAIVAVVSRIIDHRMSLEDALAAPRVYPQRRGFEAEIGTGLGFMPEDIEAMRALDFDVEVIDREGAFGRVHAVLRDAASGTWIAVADPDWEGAAAGVGMAAGGG